jgi:hypothetical protein
MLNIISIRALDAFLLAHEDEIATDYERLRLAGLDTTHLPPESMGSLRLVFRHEFNRWAQKAGGGGQGYKTKAHE